MAADTETKTTRKPLSPADKLQKLNEQKAALEKRIAAEEAKKNVQDRKDDTRAKIIIGGAVIADMQLHPETRRGVMEVLNRAVTKPRDRELLERRGLLD